MMPCEEVLRLLDDYVDGQLGLERSDAVAAHIAHCASCRRAEERTRRLVDVAAALPAQIPPDRDLWPGIADRLDAEVVRFDGRHSRKRRYRWTAAAAAVLVVAAIAVVAIRSGPPTTGSPTNPLRTEGATLAGLTGDPGLAAALAEYQRAATALRAALAGQSASLPPATRRVVESNLAIVDAAVLRLTSALAADPGNHDLALLLTAAYERQLDLLLTANQLTRT